MICQISGGAWKVDGGPRLHSSIVVLDTIMIYVIFHATCRTYKSLESAGGRLDDDGGGEHELE
jgi:hypothetical protein